MFPFLNVLTRSALIVEMICLVSVLFFVRVLVYGLNFSPEQVGIGKYSSELCASLASQGHQLRVITSPP